MKILADSAHKELACHISANKLIPNKIVMEHSTNSIFRFLSSIGNAKFFVATVTVLVDVEIV